MFEFFYAQLMAIVLSGLSKIIFMRIICVHADGSKLSL